MMNNIFRVAIFCLIFYSCQESNLKQSVNQLPKVEQLEKVEYLETTKKLEIGDKIDLYGGYDYNPLYLKNPPSDMRRGTVIKFIQGHNENPASVVKLDHKITGDSVTGDIVILELRYEGQTWVTNGPVHIELCNFEPEDKSWKDRKKGEWVEAAAHFKIIKK